MSEKKRGEGLSRSLHSGRDGEGCGHGVAGKHENGEETVRVDKFVQVLFFSFLKRKINTRKWVMDGLWVRVIRRKKA